jgi:hypothetical protein
MMARSVEDDRRGRRSPSGRRVWQFSLLFLLVLTTIWAVLLSVSKTFPLETFIMATVFAIAGIGIVLYIGELVVVGWIVDFLSEIGMSHFQAAPAPLECERAGEILVVTLRDNIATTRQCQAVQEQLQCLIDEHHCDFVLDFLYAGNIATSFRAVMVYLTKAARREADNLGKPYRPVALPRGESFPSFEDRQRAVEEMSRHGGHGWVVLCSVPVGIRAVSYPA